MEALIALTALTAMEIVLGIDGQSRGGRSGIDVEKETHRARQNPGTNSTRMAKISRRPNAIRTVSTSLVTGVKLV